MLYLYEARNKSGRTVTGVLDAKNPEDAAYQLYGKKLEVIRLEKRRERRVPERDVILFTRVLASGLSARLPLPRALETAWEELPKRNPMRPVLETVLAAVRSGQSFPEALESHPRVFSPLYRSLVLAGEKSGKLPPSLDQALTILTKNYRLRRSVVSALTYPAFVLSFGVVVLVFFMTGIMPRFQQSYRDLGGNLPAFTKFVIGISSWFQAYLPALAAGALAAVAAVWAARRVQTVRLWMDRRILDLPVFGNIRRKTMASRFARTVGILLSGGRTVQDAVGLCRGLFRNDLYGSVVDRTVRALDEGGKLSVALKESGLFPPALIQMTSMGEETGKLQELMGYIADFYEKELDSSVETITGLLTPVLIVILGVIIGIMALGLFLPIIEIGTLIQ